MGLHRHLPRTAGLLSGTAGLLGRFLLDRLLFPQTCCHCREDLPGPRLRPEAQGGPGPPPPEALCADCAGKLAPAKPPWCARCGDRVPSSRTHCRPCSRRLFSCSVIRPAVYYGGPAASVVHALKYRNRRDAARLAGRLMAEALERLPELRGAHALVPVPLHPARLRERGFNQALRLAHEIGALTGKPVAGFLFRRLATRPQWRLRRHERARNLDNAFAADQASPDGFSDSPAGKKLLLIDDVCTTSSTLEGCGRALRQAGAAKVSALVFARQSRSTAGGRSTRRG